MDNVNVLERAASIAKDNLTKIQAPSVEKAKAEASVAAADKAKVEQAKKDEGIKLASEAEAKTKEDERILNTEDTKLSESESVRKTELKEAKRKEDESPEAKIKRVQEASQKRIDEIKSEMLAKENQTAQKMAALEAKLAELEKPKQVEDLKSKINREQSEQIAKYIEEDKSKPKEQRREMSKDSLDEWYLEDPVEATKWIQRTEYRRMRDLEKAEESLSKPVDNTDAKDKLLKEFINKQNESRGKLLAKFPDIRPSNELILSAKKEAGVPLDRLLTSEELEKVNKKIDEKSEMFRLCREISYSDPKKYIESENGPELVMQEMEKRLKNTGNSGKSEKIELTQEELDARIQAEIKRRELVDGEGITSSTGGKRKVDEKIKGELRQKQEAIAKKAKMTVEQLDKVIERRKTIPGAGSFNQEE